MRLEAIPEVIGFDPFVTSPNETEHEPGDPVYLSDGRVFRFAVVGASNISKGKLQLAPAHITNHDNCAVAAAPIGSTVVTVTPGATGANANVYSYGYMVVNAGPGAGQTYKISSHPTITASTAFNLTLFDPINTALTTSSKVCLMHNTYNGVVQGTSSTQTPAGVPLVDMPAGYYGWLQTRGIAAVLCDTITSLGGYQIASGSVPGAVTDQTDVTAPITQRWVGWAPVAGVNGEYRPVFLMID